MPTEQSLHGRLLVFTSLLKATVKKQVWVPQFTKKNGQVVGGHYAHVHVTDDHDHHKVASGQGSYSQKKAHAQLADEPAFHALPTAEEKAAVVMHHATQIQDAESQAARIATLKKKLLAGGKPTPSEWKHFHAAPPEKQQAVTEAVHAAGQGAHMDSLYSDYVSTLPPANVPPVEAEPPAPPAPKEPQAAPKEEPKAEPESAADKLIATVSAGIKEASQSQAFGKKIVADGEALKKKYEGKTVPPMAQKIIDNAEKMAAKMAKHAPKAAAPEQAPAPAAAAPAALAMPEFTDGKTTTGVKDYYEKVGAKIIALANAGDVAALEAMPNPEKGNSWKGKTPNSKALLGLHAAALAHAKGEKPAAPAAAPAPAAEPAKGMSNEKYVSILNAMSDAKSEKEAKAAYQAYIDAGGTTGDAAMAQKQALGHLFEAGWGDLSEKLGAEAAPAAEAPAAAPVDAKKKAQLELVDKLAAAGHTAMIGSKGVLLASSPDYPKTYANQTQASNAAQKLLDAGFDCEVIGMHPYMVKVHSFQSYLVKKDGPKEGDTKQGKGGTLVLKDGHWVLQPEGASAMDFVLDAANGPKPVKEAAQEWLQAHPGQEAEVASALTTLGYDEYAKEYEPKAPAPAAAPSNKAELAAAMKPYELYDLDAADFNSALAYAYTAAQGKTAQSYTDVAESYKQSGDDHMAEKYFTAAANIKAKEQGADTAPANDAELQQLVAGFEAAKVPAENTNAKAYNPKVDQIIAALKAGDTAALLGMSYGTNTYGKKAAKLANEALQFLGTRHEVTPGQKAGTHPKLKVVGVKVGAPAAPAPAAAAENPAPAVAEPAAAAPAPAAPVPPAMESLNGTAQEAVKSAQAAFAAGDLAKLEILEASTSGLYSFNSTNAYIKECIAHLQAGDQQQALISGWTAAIASGMVPSKEQAEFMDGLKHSDPDAYEEAKSEAQAQLATEVMGLMEMDDASFEQSHEKLHDLHKQALGGAAPTATTGLTEADLAKVNAGGIDPEYGAQIKKLAMAGDLAGLEGMVAELSATGWPTTASYAAALATLLEKKQGSALPAPSGKVANSEAAAQMYAAAQQGDKAQLISLLEQEFDDGDPKVHAYGMHLKELISGKPAGAVDPAVVKAAYGAKNIPALQELLLQAVTAKQTQMADDITKMIQNIGAGLDDGPKEGDTKQGADGMLVFENGRWHKMGTDPKVLKQKAASVPMPKLKGTNSIKLTKVMKAIKEAAETGGAEALGKIVKLTPGGHVKALGFNSINPEGSKYGEAATAFAKYAKAMIQTMDGTKGTSAPKAAPAAAGATSAPSAAPKATSPAPAGIKTLMVSRILNGGIKNADHWTKTGNQQGSNSGGFYTDSDGVQWYVKTPESDAHVKNELLANKLYAALGMNVPEVKQVKLGGKLSIASKVVPGLKKDPEALKTSDDMLMGFAADAWLANWDSVGLSYDNALVDQSGKVHRIDPGGALIFRAQGTEKGAAFGSTVTELETLRDASKNPQAASVFGKMTPEQIEESVKQVLLLKDSAITKLCMAYGPGDKAAREALAATLIARKADLAAKFPNAAKAAGPQKKVFIAPAPNFKEWNGPGQGLSSKAHVNEQNQQLANEMQALAADGNLAGLEAMQFQPINKDTGAAEGEKQPIAHHKSKHIPLYWKDLVNALKNPVRSMEHMKDAVVETVGGVFGTLASAFADVKGLKDAAAKIGRYALIGKVDGDPFESWKVKELSQANGAINAKDLYDQSQAAYKALSNIERQAIQQYTGSGYSSMNNAATGVGSHSNTDFAIAGFDKASVPLKPGTVLSRKFSFGSQADLEKFLAAEGGIVKDFGMISTSLRPSVWSGNVHLRIVCGEGVKGCYVAPDPVSGGKAISVNPGEQEVVLPYGTKFFVRKVYQKGHTFKDEHGQWGTGGHVIEIVALPNT